MRTCTYVLYSEREREREYSDGAVLYLILHTERKTVIRFIYFGSREERRKREEEEKKSGERRKDSREKVHSSFFSSTYMQYILRNSTTLKPFIRFEYIENTSYCFGECKKE